MGNPILGWGFGDPLPRIGPLLAKSTTQVVTPATKRTCQSSDFFREWRDCTLLEAARCWPAQEDWALGWVGRIGQLYKANEARLEALDNEPAAFAARDGQLRRHVEQMAAQAEQELSAPQ